MFEKVLGSDSLVLNVIRLSYLLGQKEMADFIYIDLTRILPLFFYNEIEK